MPDASSLRLLLWTAGAARCGASIAQLQEVLPAPPILPIPGAPAPVLGLANVRGALVTVVDCRTLLGEPAVAPARDLVLVRLGGALVGLAVDAVEDLHAVPDAALRPGPAGEWRAGVGGVETRVLDLEGLLAPLFPE